MGCVTQPNCRSGDTNHSKPLAKMKSVPATNPIPHISWPSYNFLHSRQLLNRCHSAQIPASTEGVEFILLGDVLCQDVKKGGKGQSGRSQWLNIRLSF